MADVAPGGNTAGATAHTYWIVNDITRPGGPRGPQQTHYVIVDSASRPINAIEGPFTSYAAAKNKQSSDNSAGNSPGSVAGRAANDLFKGLNLASILLRVGEVIVGAVLIGIGVNSMAKGKPFNLVTSAAGLAGKVIPLWARPPG